MGSIIDIAIDKSGKIIELLVQRKRFIFFSSNTVSIRWGQIDKIGKDVILVSVKS